MSKIEIYNMNFCKPRIAVVEILFLIFLACKTVIVPIKDIEYDNLIYYISINSGYLAQRFSLCKNA